MLDADTFTSPERLEVALRWRPAPPCRPSTPCSGPGDRSRPRGCGAGAPARPPRRGRSGDGLLSLNNVAVAAAHARAAGWRASRSSTSTCTTATARRAASTTTRRCCSSRRTSFRSIRAPARPPRSAAATGRVHRERAARGGRHRRRLRARLRARSSLPVLDEFTPELLLVSAGFDAHERRSARRRCA